MLSSKQIDELFGHLTSEEQINAAMDELQAERDEIDPMGKLYVGEIDPLMEALEFKLAILNPTPRKDQ